MLRKKMQPCIEHGMLLATLKGHFTQVHFLQEALPDDPTHRDLALCVPFWWYLTDCEQELSELRDQGCRSKRPGEELTQAGPERTCHGAGTELRALHAVHLAYPTPREGKNSSPCQAQFPCA